jgi:hypothetical protein
MLVYHHMADVRLVGNTSGNPDVTLETTKVSDGRRKHTTNLQLAHFAGGESRIADRR